MYSNKYLITPTKNILQNTPPKHTPKTHPKIGGGKGEPRFPLNRLYMTNI